MKNNNRKKLLGPVYFWYLNTFLDPAELRRQLREMKKMGVQCVCPHPWPPEFRPLRMPSDMSPEYLSEAYFDCFKVIYDECARLKMVCMLYDEGGWPSGGAGGRVRAAEPEKWAPRYQTHEGEFIQPADPGFRAPLPNLLISGTAEKFIELTHERYFRRFPELFGNMIPYAFTDEPQTPECRQGERIAWAPGLEKEFRKRYGYDIGPWIHDLIDDKAPPRVRIDYHDLVSDLFAERFFKVLRTWCRKHRILSGGHLSGEHEPFKSARYGHGHIMRCLRMMDLPGVDAIKRQVFPGQENGDFPKLASSVAHQAGRKYALAEIFAVYGNGVTPEERCFLADYMQVRGVNILVISKIALTHKKHFMMGCRPHFGPVDPLWKYSAPFHEYCHRTAEAMTAGKPVIDTAVYFDQRSVWAGEPFRTESTKKREECTRKLLEQQCDFDFVDDDALAKAEIRDGKLVVGKMSYSALVIPSDDFMTPEARTVVGKFVSAAPVPLLHCEPAAPRLRVSRRRVGKSTFYFCVNESREPLTVKLTFDQGPVVFRDLWGSGDYSAGDTSCVWHFAPCGSALFITGGRAVKRRLPEINWEDTAELKWKLKALKRHSVGQEDFLIRSCTGKAEKTELGSWDRWLGGDFSGDALYSCTFKTERKKLWIDLGEVRYCASVKINGVPVGTLFRSPFRCDLTPGLKKGLNRLEITVSNTLANALAAPGVKEHLVNDCPPCSPYEGEQRLFEEDSLSGGLFGPVRFGSEI